MISASGLVPEEGPSWRVRHVPASSVGTLTDSGTAPAMVGGTVRVRSRSSGGGGTAGIVSGWRGASGFSKSSAVGIVALRAVGLVGELFVALLPVYGREGNGAATPPRGDARPRPMVLGVCRRLLPSSRIWRTLSRPLFSSWYVGPHRQPLLALRACAVASSARQAAEDAQAAGQQLHREMRHTLLRHAEELAVGVVDQWTF